MNRTSVFTFTQVPEETRGRTALLECRWEVVEGCTSRAVLLWNTSLCQLLLLQIHIQIFLH